ncbi:MAG: hypothetical protein JNL83_38145 [Myxococcales bacterium]|nr:hypothetical protein [Myxococcales bacterium]
MAPLKYLALASALAGCGDLEGFGGEVTALATIRFEATGDFEAVRVPGATGEQLRVALVWAEQWLPEAMCILPPESPEVGAAVAAGCRNPLSFSPDRVTDNVALGDGELVLTALPAADLMVGDVTARVAYASLVIYDDRDETGTLELGRARRFPQGGFDPGPDVVPTRDVIYGASFVAMTEPDTRLAFREGDYLESGFYPRRGCGVPLPAFSVLSAGGFSFAQAIAATAAGMLPSQDPATCAEAKPEDTVVRIPFRVPAEVQEVGCDQRREDSTVRYRQPPDEPLDLANLTYACAKIPAFGGETPPDLIQLLVASPADDRCKGLTHYTLFGCDESENLTCDVPEWDFRANPPAWWPCPVSP